MEQNETYSQKSEISISDVLYKLIEKWYVVVASVLVFVISATVYVNFFCTPLYSSTAKLFIFNTDSTNMQSSSEVTISTYLARDYAELIVDRTVLETVIDNLGVKYSYGALKSAVSVDNPDGTRILEITVKSKNAREAKKIADEICQVAKEKIVDLMGIGRVNIISEGHIPSSPSYPDKRQYIFTAFAAALLLSAILIFIMLVTSDKIESEEDIQKYLDMSVLATIPYASTAAKKKTAKARRKK